MTHETNIRFISTFTGIGGFEEGISQAIEDCNRGYAEERQRDGGALAGPDQPHVQRSAHCLGYSEIDRYAGGIYRARYPEHHALGDIKAIDAVALPAFDFLVGGFPCQSFSIAGKRGGFQDTRGTLFFDLARILEAKRPRLLLFENVKGLLSHDGGRTFWTIIATLDELGYGVQWQVLNSKNFGVPQNRERVFIVGHLRGTPRPEVFPIRPRPGIRAEAHEAEEQEIAPTLHAAGGGPDVNDQFVAHTLKARADSGIDEKHPQTLILQRNRGTNKGGEKKIAPALSPSKYDHNNLLIPEPTAKGYAIASPGDTINLSLPNSATRRGRVGKGVAQTLDTGMRQYTIVARNQRNEVREMDVAGAIPAHPGQKQGQWVAPAQGLNHPSRGIEAREDGLQGTLKGGRSGSQRPKAIVGEGIRRLTPIECERLQGFQDGWTANGYFEAGDIVWTGTFKKGKPVMTKAKEGGIYPVSDTQRYKTLGNAVTVPVIREIARRIFEST